MMAESALYILQCSDIRNGAADPIHPLNQTTQNQNIETFFSSDNHVLLQILPIAKRLSSMHYLKDDLRYLLYADIYP